MGGSRSGSRRSGAWVGRRLASATTIALIALIATAGGASADPKTGCPVGSGWNEMTVEDVAARVWPALLDQSPWANEADFRESAVRPYDRNGDGSICLKILWGEQLNPNSHWYLVGVDVLGAPTEQFLPRDNTSNASNTT
jgi:hypothetical protein